MKKTIALLTAAAMLLLLAACGGSAPAESTAPAASSSAAASEEAPAPEAPAAEPAAADASASVEAAPSAAPEEVEEPEEPEVIELDIPEFETPEAWMADGLDLSGMLALQQYVFTAAQDEIADGAVTTDCYGVYTPGEPGEARFIPADYADAIAVYTDSACTIPADGVTAAVADGALTLTGVAEKENTAYYLATEAGEFPTPIYVVCTAYDQDAATLTLADGTSIDLTTYAPNMAKGDYTALTDANEIDGNPAVFIGGNRTAVSIADFTDSENFSGSEDAVAWYIQSGITNSGDHIDRFGDKMYVYEYAVGLYRLFQIVVDQTTATADYKDPTDFSGAMFSNDPYSDSVSATLQAGIWNGIYTEQSDVKDLGEGFYLLQGIDGVTTLGTGAVVNVEYAYVGMYNAFASAWTMLNDDGIETAAALADAAAEADGGKKEAPEDYSNEAKIAAVSSVLLGEDQAPAAAKPLTKAEVVEVLYAARNLVKAKTAPDTTRAEQTGSPYADVSQYLTGEYATPVVITEEYAGKIAGQLDGMHLISTQGAALYANNAGTVDINNTTISLVGNADNAAAAITGLYDSRYALDGAEAVTDPTHDGFVYNATSRNAFYRFAVGTAAAIWGKDTIVNLRSDNGTLVLDGEAGGSSTPPGTMAGTAYVGFGASLNITNAVAYSSSQHLTNNLYNGTVHYVDSAAFGSGRVYSSDFWGGYQVFEDSVAYGGCVTDEPTTLIVKNSLYGNSVGGNGYASQYFENSILNVSTATFQNTTSLVTDTGSMTAVNSVINCSSECFAAATGCERAIFTLVDSKLNLSGNVLATVGNREQVNAITMETVAPENADAYQALYDGQMAIRFYGDNEIQTSDGTLTVNIAAGATLTIYSSNLTEKDITVQGDGEVVVVTDNSYGKVTLK